MSDGLRRFLLLVPALVLSLVAWWSVTFLQDQLAGRFDSKRLNLRSPASADALTQTLTTFKYRDEAGQEQTLDLQARYRPPENAPEGAPKQSLYDDAVAAASFRTQTTIVVLFIAFGFAALLTIFVALQSVRELGGFSPLSVIGAAFLAGVGAVGGYLLVGFEPVGPVVSYDIPPPASGGLLFALGLKEALGQQVTVVTNLIRLSGIAAGATIGFVLHFLWWAVRDSGGKEDPLLLWRRKRSLGTVVTLASIALSLGIGMIMSFLGWGANFLDDTSRPVVEELANAGGSYWGGMLTIFTLTTVAHTAMCIHFDISKAANSWARSERKLKERAVLISVEASTGAISWAGSEPAETVEKGAEASPVSGKPEDLSLALDWKKKNDLDFDPLKTVGTVVAALGPVLTSILVPALSSSLA